MVVGRHIRYAALGAALCVTALSSVARAQPAQPAQPAGQATSGGEISLSVGEQRVIPTQGIRQFSEGVPGIVDVRTPSDGSRLVVVGTRPGTTSLLLIRSDGRQETLEITVFARRPEAVQAEIENLLEGYSGVQIRRVGARLYIEGGVASEQQQRRVQQIAELYRGQVESLVTISPTIVERRINVRLDLYFVEFSATSGRQVGLAWPASIGGNPPQVQGTATINIVPPVGGMVGAGVTSAQAIITQQPLPRLDITARTGYSRILRQATIITANGSEATYRNGGEFNFRLIGGNGSASLATIQYGTTLTVTPRYDPQSSRIDIRVNTDISDPVERGQDLPGRDISHLETLVNLQLGQSIVMSGFRSRQQSRGSSGLPLLHEIPILGYLFGSEGAQDQEREGVIFIIPTVVEGMNRQSQDRVAEALRAYEEFSGDIDDEDSQLYRTTPNRGMMPPTGTQYR